MSFVHLYIQSSRRGIHYKKFAYAKDYILKIEHRMAWLLYDFVEFIGTVQ